MSDTQESHCRLCAELTVLNQLISIDDDAGLNSKIKTKMLYINIDVSPSNSLPKSICFSCFGLLERTWLFLTQVRFAQVKLASIFAIVESCKQNDIGKPLDQDWDDFVKTETQPEQAQEKVEIKRERSYSLEIDYPSDHSFDSDSPLNMVAEKKVRKRKRKKHKESEIEPSSVLPGLPIDMSVYTMTWDDYTWCCGKCDAQCKSVDLLRLHSIEIHNTCCTFKCSDCGKICTNYKIFIKHVQGHYKSLRYHCELCNKHYKMTSLVKKHRKTHRELYCNVCRHCGACFDSSDLLDDHLAIYSKSMKRGRRKVDPDGELKCDVCNREFRQRSNLIAHKVTHTQRSREFSCHVCGKMFFTKGALGTHMATHEETKPYKCEFCSLSFRARGNLNSHITVHSAAKPFVCEQCGKSFRVKRHLKSHSIIHTDLMPFVCEYCNMKFRYKTRLNLHVRQHTGVKPYRCVYCLRDFVNGSNYKKHMKRRHNIDTSVRKKTVVNEPILVNMEEPTVADTENP